MRYRCQFSVDVDADDPMRAAKVAIAVLRGAPEYAVVVVPMPEGHPVWGSAVEFTADPAVPAAEVHDFLQAVKGEESAAAGVPQVDSRCAFCGAPRKSHPVTLPGSLCGKYVLLEGDQK